MARDENRTVPRGEPWTLGYDLFELGATIIEMVDRLTTMDKVIPGASVEITLDDDESGLRFIISARVDRSCPQKETGHD